MQRPFQVAFSEAVWSVKVDFASLFRDREFPARRIEGAGEEDLVMVDCLNELVDVREYG